MPVQVYVAQWMVECVCVSQSNAFVCSRNAWAKAECLFKYFIRFDLLACVFLDLNCFVLSLTRCTRLLLSLLPLWPCCLPLASFILWPYNVFREYFCGAYVLVSFLSHFNLFAFIKGINKGSCSRVFVVVVDTFRVFNFSLIRNAARCCCSTSFFPLHYVVVVVDLVIFFCCPFLKRFSNSVCISIRGHSQPASMFISLSINAKSAHFIYSHKRLHVDVNVWM